MSRIYVSINIRVKNIGVENTGVKNIGVKNTAVGNRGVENRGVENIGVKNKGVKNMSSIIAVPGLIFDCVLLFSLAAPSAAACVVYAT